MKAVIKKLTRSFQFHHYTEQDIAQQCWVAAMSIIKKYNPKYHNLELYLFWCVRQKLLNLRRDHFRDPVAPCKESHKNYLHGVEDYSPEYERWVKNNQAKQRVRVASQLGDYEPSKCSVQNMENRVLLHEIYDIAKEKMSKRNFMFFDMFYHHKIELPQDHPALIELRGILNVDKDE